MSNDKPVTHSGETVVSFPNPETMDREAAEWIVKLDRDDVADDVRAAWEDWRSQSDLHRDAFDRAAVAWQTLEGLESLKPIRESKLAEPNLLERAGLEVRHRFAVAAGVTATAAIVLSLIITPPFFSPADDVQQAYRTVIGTQKTVLLPDGSELLLNTDSAVDVALTDSARTIRLHKGEVHFTVAPDKDRPFSVYVDNRVVTATGTAFTVYRRETDIEVTVTEGGVDLYVLSQHPEEAIVPDTAITDSPLANLKAGENAVVGETIEQVLVIPPPEMNRKLAWRQGLLAFAGDPLSDVVAEVSRYTDMQIIIRDPALRDIEFGGFLKIGNVDTLFNALEQSFGVHVQRDSNSIVYLSLSKT